MVVALLKSKTSWHGLVAVDDVQDAFVRCVVQFHVLESDLLGLIALPFTVEACQIAAYTFSPAVICFATPAVTLARHCFPPQEEGVRTIEALSPAAAEFAPVLCFVLLISTGLRRMLTRCHSLT